MRFEPSKLFFGVVDLFSVLLPGALLTWMVRDPLGPGLFGAAYPDLPSATAWAAFLFGAYLLGHFVFLLGTFLDELVYAPVRRATAAHQVRRLARGGGLAPRLLRTLADHLFSSKLDRAVVRTVALKSRALAPVDAADAINAYQWSKVRLLREHPDALASVQRFEADSKFFRSLVVVLAVLGPWAWFQGSPVLAGLCGPLMLLALWRYAEQRGKSTARAYWHVLALEAEEATSSTGPGPFGAPTHGGGVVVRETHGEARYLLVRPRTADPTAEWVLPKGHLEVGESTAEAAVREVREEAGVWARVRGEVGEVRFQVAGDEVRVVFHLMEPVEDPGEGAGERGRRWVSASEVGSMAMPDEARRVLERAEVVRREVGGPQG